MISMGIQSLRLIFLSSFALLTKYQLAAIVGFYRAPLHNALRDLLDRELQAYR